MVCVGVHLDLTYLHGRDGALSKCKESAVREPCQRETGRLQVWNPAWSSLGKYSLIQSPSGAHSSIHRCPFIQSVVLPDLKHANTQTHTDVRMQCQRAK